MCIEIVSNFICCGEDIVAVKLEHKAYIMSYQEWKVYEKNRGVKDAHR